MSKNKLKHFLDTSILRLFIHGSRLMKKYLKKELTGDKYISRYIKTEFNKSFICTFIKFYFFMDQDTIESIEHALNLWNEKFETRQIKLIGKIVPSLLNEYKLDFKNPFDKEKSLILIYKYILRILLKVDCLFIYKEDSTLCAHTNIDFEDYINVENARDRYDLLYKFYNFYERKDKCRNVCEIDKFIFNKSKYKLKSFLNSKDIKISGSNKNDFNLIIKNIENIIINNEENNFTCRQCIKISDAIIAIICPAEMRLETTNYSFDYLMNILGKKHKRHASELTLFKKHKYTPKKMVCPI